MALSNPSLLPAIAVLRLASGEPHFVLLWRRRGTEIEVMDPAVGRLLLPADDLEQRLWRYETEVDAAAWLDFAASSDFAGPLRRRLGALGVSDAASATFLRAALQAGTPLAPALLDAATRYIAALVGRDRGLRGRHAQLLLDRLLAEATSWDSARGLVPAEYWAVEPLANSEALIYRGAVFLAVERVTAPRLRARVQRANPILLPLLRAVALVKADGGGVLALLMLFAGAATAAGFAELLLFRSLVDVSSVFAPGLSQLAALAALLLVVVAGLLVRQALASESFRLGRIIETELRIALIERLPDIRDTFFATRSSADMGERIQALQLLRMLPGQLLHLAQAILEPLVLVAALAMLDSSALLPGILGLVLGTGLASLAALRVRGAEQRQRSSGAALAESLLDMLRGLVPIRLHRAESAFLARYQAGLARWMAETRSLQRLQRGSGLAIELLLLGVSAIILTLHFAGLSGSSATDLLFAYWTLRLPIASRTLATLAGGIAIEANVLERLQEPLAHAEPRAAAPEEGKGPVSVALSGDLVRGGVAVLEGLNLDIAAGEHVAIVGPSGAGKSSLIGLFLDIGSFSGSVGLDGRPAGPAERRALASATIAIDPAAQLYDLTLAENLSIGLPPGVEPAYPDFLSLLVDSLPYGEATRLGESALLLSGGEAQRLRLARALNRAGARLVLADEPFRGLDRAERARLMAHLRRAFDGTTLLCATHDIADTLGFDRVVVLEGGRIVAEGRPQDLLRNRSLYLDLLRAEEDAADLLWSGRDWRRLRLEAGQLHEPR